jgi:hypothetical protein
MRACTDEIYTILNICPERLFLQVWNVYPNKFRPYNLYCFSKYKIFSKNLNVLNAVFSKQNILCFQIRWPSPVVPKVL